MAGLLDFLSGRTTDIYGEGLLTPEQRGGLGNIGLLALAGKLGQLAGPSFSPVPDFGAALGQAAGAYGASQEGAGTAALNAILTAQKGRKLQQEIDYSKQLGPILSKLAGDWPAAGGGAGGGEGSGSSGSTGGGAAAPLGAGGGGADPSETDIIGRESGGKPYVGYGGVDLSNAPLNEYGFPIWAGKMGPAGISHAAGLYQFQPGTWATYAGPLGIRDFSPESQRKVYLAARAAEGARPWAASAGGGGGRAAAAPTAAAPAGGGGLPAPTAPNPLSDAEPMVPVVRSGGGPLAARAPADDDARLRSLYNGAVGRLGSESFEQYKARVGPSFGAGNSGGGGLLAAPPGAGTDAYVTPQGPAGDPGPPGPAGPATPRAALPTMGPTGIELPPMQGPLAAPAPAAAAPAAAGPGLLAAPGAPAAALPRVNPAYDAYLRNLGVAGALAKGAGLPDVFGPLTGALKDSPAYQAQVELAKRLGVFPLIGPEAAARTEAEKREALKYDPLIEEEKRRRTLPFTLQEETFKSQLRNLENGRVLDPATGQFKEVPGYNPTLESQETSKARGSKSQDVVEVDVQGADGRSYTVKMPQTDYVQRMRDQPPPAPGQAPAPGAIVGVRRTGPLDEMGKEALKDAGAAAKVAYGRMQEYGQLALAAQNFTTGPTTEKWFEVKRYLKDAGIIAGTEVPDQEIFQLAQKRLAVAAAPKGQGATSDFERSLYASALPSMATSKEGLARAIAIANRLDQYDVKVAQIHEDVARNNNGYPDYLEVQRRVRELGPPLSDQEKAALQGATNPGAAALPVGVPQGTKQVGTFQGKPVYEYPDGSRKVMQ